jgi:hypothetical protein
VGALSSLTGFVQFKFAHRLQITESAIDDTPDCRLADIQTRFNEPSGAIAPRGVFMKLS